MRRLFIGLGILVIAIAGVIAYFVFWPPTVRMTVLPESQVPERTRQLVMPLIVESGKNYALRVYGSGDGYEYIGYTVKGVPRGLFVYTDNGKPMVTGGTFETPFDARYSWVFDNATQKMASFRAYGGAMDARITKVVGTTADGQKVEAVPQNGFWWLWVNGSGQWSKFEALGQDGRVLYTKTVGN